MSHISLDNSGNGTYSITTLQGKHNKCISFISTYIAVTKGGNIGIKSIYSQQVTIYEDKALKVKRSPTRPFNPRTDAIECLDDTIADLQYHQRVVILMIDANEYLQEYFTSNGVKPYSIEWLHPRWGMDDPFVQTMGQWSNSTTLHPNRDIGYLNTFGIPDKNIFTLILNQPAHSDHLGIIFDLDLKSFFSSTYSDISQPVPRVLTTENERSVTKYIDYVSQQIINHNIHDQIKDLYKCAADKEWSITETETSNKLNDQLISIMLVGEQQCSPRKQQCQPWSPQQRVIAITFSYWKQKLAMANKKLFHCGHLDQLWHHTDITDSDHQTRDSSYIYEQTCKSRAK